MIKRTIKPAAGESRVSARDAKIAAREVHRDRTTGRLVVIDADHSAHDRRRSDPGYQGDTVKK